MDFFKKIGKEVSVFGLVFVVFIALFAYRQVTHVELSTISQDKLEEKIKDKDSFVVVVGSDKDNTTLNYKNVCLKYLEKNHSDKIYYVNLAKENNDYYKDYTDYEDAYKVQVSLIGTLWTPNFQDNEQKPDWIVVYSKVDEQGNLKYMFECKGIEYHSSSGRVKNIKFDLVKK